MTTCPSPAPERAEEQVTLDGSTRARPDEVWHRAAAAFERWTQGDPLALDELVAAMTPVLWQVARAHRLDAAVAEDVVQSAWLALIRRRDAIEDARAVGAWLTTAVRREAWRAARAAGRTLATEDDELARLDDDAHRAERADRSAEAEVLAADDSRRLWAAVDRLSERCRRLLRIVAFEHRPDYARISADLEMPVGSIGPTRARCLDKLRTALTEGEPDA